MIIFTDDEEKRKKLGPPRFMLLFPTTNGFWHIKAYAHTQHELEDWCVKNTDPMMVWFISEIKQQQG